MDATDWKLSMFPGMPPESQVLWPVPQHKSNQIQQTKGSAKPQAPFVLPTNQPNQSIVQPRTTPQEVSHLRVVTQKDVNGQKSITVQFTHPSGDPYFAGANVYLRRSGQQPTLVAGGATSPISFQVPTSDAPHTIHVTSFGNWGETDVLTSPSTPVKLAASQQGKAPTVPANISVR